LSVFKKQLHDFHGDLNSDRQSGRKRSQEDWRSYFEVQKKKRESEMMRRFTASITIYCALRRLVLRKKKLEEGIPNAPSHAVPFQLEGKRQPHIRAVVVGRPSKKPPPQGGISSLMPAAGFWPRQRLPEAESRHDIYHKTTITTKDIYYSATNLPLFRRSVNTPTIHSHSLPALHQKLVSASRELQPAWRPMGKRPLTAPHQDLMATKVKPLKLLNRNAVYTYA
jgi:hypothetical protein